MLFVNPYNPEEVERVIKKLIEEDRLHVFYNSSEWKQLRLQVLKEYKYECQRCKKKGFYTRATTVHHRQYVRKHPRYAMSKSYTFRGKEYLNLEPLCHACHEEEHDYRRAKPSDKFTNQERW